MPRMPTVGHWRGPEPMWRLWAPVVAAVVRILFRVRLVGAEHIPRTGGVIVVANHVSHLDTILLLAVLWRCGRRARFLALADLWRVPVVGWLLHHGHMIPVERGGPSADALRAAGAALAADQAIVVYPEGRIAAPGEVLPAQRGAGYLALRSGCPVLPVAMSGVPPWRAGLPPLRRRVTVVVGRPRTFGGGEDDRGAQRRASDEALAAVRDLLEGAA